MLRRFLLSMLSSWLVNPLGVLAAQWFGVANAPVILLVLLATSACVPFQLLLNECLAASVNRGTTGPSRAQVSLILIVQAGACLWTVWALTGQNFGLPEAVLVSLLATANILLSYRATLTYFGLALRSRITSRAAVIIGASPGLTSLFLYLAYCLSSLQGLAVAPAFIYAAVIVPTLAQWLYVQYVARLDADDPATESCALPRVKSLYLVLALASLAGLAAASTHLRESIASVSAEYMALLLVMLNSLLSLVNTATRAKFLTLGSGSMQRTLATFALGSTLAFGILQALDWKAAPLFALLAVQASIAWVIESSRRLPPQPA